MTLLFLVSEVPTSQREITLPLVIPEYPEYCVIGIYSQEKFASIITILMDIMFFEKE